MTNNNNEIFENVLKKLLHRRRESERLEQEAKTRQEADDRNRREIRQREIALLITFGEHNIRSLLADDAGRFLEYMTSVFKKSGGYSYEDYCNVCGFPEQPVEKSNTPSNESTGVEGLLATVGDFLGRKPSFIRILPLYEENIPRPEDLSTFHACEIIGPGNSRPEKAQILALAVKVANGFGDATPAEIKTARLVHLSRTTNDHLGQVDYDTAVPVSLDNGFINALLKIIVSPKSAFEFFLEKFGTPFEQV